jgi:hypothetical protein
MRGWLQTFFSPSCFAWGLCDAVLQLMEGERHWWNNNTFFIKPHTVKSKQSNLLNVKDMQEV